MLRPFLLTRASIGLAATAAEQAVALPGRTIEAVSTLPALPVRIAGGVVQSYLHVGQTLTAFAVKGDDVLASVFATRSDQPEWATFDEDEADSDEPLDVSYTVYGSTGPADADHAAEEEPDVPTGRVVRRRP